MTTTILGPRSDLGDPHPRISKRRGTRNRGGCWETWETSDRWRQSWGGGGGGEGIQGRRPKHVREHKHRTIKKAKDWPVSVLMPWFTIKKITVMTHQSKNPDRLRTEDHGCGHGKLAWFRNKTVSPSVGFSLIQVEVNELVYPIANA